MPSVSRIIGTPAGRQSLRRLFGKVAYFPVSRGFSRKYGIRSGTESDNIPPNPPDSKATEPEWRLGWAHLILGLKPGEDFIFQHDIFGDGSTVVDFYELINIVIEVQGFYHHYVGYDPFQHQRDRDRRVRLVASNHPVIYIDEMDAMRDPVMFLRYARQGRDLSRFARGVA